MVYLRNLARNPHNVINQGRRFTLNKSKQIFSVLLAATFLSPLAPVTSFAREKITQVSLSFSMDPDSWENLNVDCEDESYSVRTVNLFPDGSATSSFPYAVIVLDAEDDYYFTSIKPKYFELEGEGAVFQEAARSNSNSTMTLSVRLKNLGEGELEEPTSLVWTDTGIATWDEVLGAGNYSVRLRRDGEAVSSSSSPTTKVTVYNLSTKITKPGNYTFQVKANGLYKKTKSSDWVTSPILAVDEAKLAYIREHASQDTGIQGQWHSDSAGTWYQYTTGEIPTNDWREIEDNWYYFDGSGYMVKNQWVDRYYVGNDGKMLKETTTPDGHYVDENGAWAPK